MSLTLVLIVFLGMVLLGVPIAFAMIGISALYFALGPIPSFVEVLPQKMFEGLDFIILTAIPFFLLAGELMNHTGMAERLMRFANLLIGHIRGGFAYVNVLASLLFSGLTGVAVGDIAALAKLEVGLMEKAGYPRHFAAAVTVSSALVGPIIPPSGIIILYAAIMNVSVGGMFLAALIPGFLMAVGDMLVIAFQARARNFPKTEVPRSARALATGTKDAGLALLMPVLMVGGIVGGIMTPTEAAAVTVIYGLLVGGVVYRKLSLRSLGRILANSGYESARLLFILAGAVTMTWIFALEDVSGIAQRMFDGLDLSPWMMVLIINLVFIVSGMFLDASIVLILLAPVLGPVFYGIGGTPYQFGIMLIVNVIVGLATPPVGNVLFAICGVVQLRLGELIREMLPFLAVKFLLLMLIGLVPALTNWLPSVFGF